MRRTHQAGIGFIFVTVIIDTLGIGLIIPVLPEIIRSFEGVGLSAASNIYGFLVAIYALLSFAFASTFGSLSDRFGRRPVLLLSLLGLGLDYIIIALAPNLAWLVVGRVISGIFGATETTAMAYIADISKPEVRAKNFGIVGAAFGLGFIVGPLLGGVLGGISLRLPFWCAASLSPPQHALRLLVLPESLDEKNRRPFSWQQANPVGSLLALRRFPNVFTPHGRVHPDTSHAQRFGWRLGALHGLPSRLDHYRGGYFAGRYRGLLWPSCRGALVDPVIKRLGEGRTIVLGLVLSTLSYVLFGLADSTWLMYVAIILSSSGGLVAAAVQGAVSNRVAAEEQGLLQGGAGGSEQPCQRGRPAVDRWTFRFYRFPQHSRCVCRRTLFPLRSYRVGSAGCGVASLSASTFNDYSKQPLMSRTQSIEVRGARENNLRNVSIDIPKNLITVFTGVSGSGKSSLVFDTVAAEAQRQLNETFTAFVQGFMPNFGQPDVDSITHLNAPIIMNQNRLGGGARSTVGTFTDMSVLLRSLFAALGEPRIDSSSAFSFNTPQGMCSECSGLGQTTQLDLTKFLDTTKSLNDGAVLHPNFKVDWIGKIYSESGTVRQRPGRSRSTTKPATRLCSTVCPRMKKLKVPLGGLNYNYEGLVERFGRMYLSKDAATMSKRNRKVFESFVQQETCPLCAGATLESGSTGESRFGAEHR